MPLQNFVDFNTPAVSAAWLNNVDKAINGTTVAQGAALVPYTPAVGSPTTVAAQLAAVSLAPGVAYTPPGAGAVTTTVAGKLSQTVSLFDFMTAAQIADVQANTLTIDCAAAIQAAFSSGAPSIFVPGYKYKLSSGVQFNGVAVYSTCFLPTNPPAGANFVLDLAVLIGVIVGGPAATNQSSVLKGISVTRAAGVPPAGSVGILVQRGNASIVEDCASISHQVPVKFLGDGTVYGITTMVNRLFTGAAYDAHVVIDTMPEVRFNQCRLGMNGPGDQNCLDYIRVQGGSTSNAANGPNTVSWENSQFNQANNTVTNLWAFRNLTPGSISDVELFQMTNCYIESDTVGFFSDATWATAINVMLTGVHYNPPVSTRQLIALNAATQINNWKLSNCGINCAMTISNSTQTNFFQANNSHFLGAVSITGLSNSTVLLGDCWYRSGLTVAGSFSTFNAIGGGISGGSLSTSGITSGNIKIDIGPNNGLQSITPTMTLGGASVGMTQSGHCGYQVFGNLVMGQFDVTLTAKGSSAGQVAINLPGLPAISTLPFNPDGGGVVTFASGFAALTGALALSIGAGPLLNVFFQGATGVGGVTDGNVTNTTAIRGTFQYFM